MRDKANQILCERRADGISFQSLSNQVRLVVLPGKTSAKVLKTLKIQYPVKEGWKHSKNAVVRTLRSGDDARLFWVNIAPDYAITPRKKDRGIYLPR